MPEARKGNTEETQRMTEMTEGTVQILEDAAPARLDLDVCRTTTPNVSVRATDKEDDEEGMPVLEGHFSTFNDWYEIKSFFEGHFMERIAPGAFKRTFNSARSSKDPHRVQVLLEHGFDPTVGDKPLGLATKLEEDGEGARYEAELFDTSYVRDILPAIRAGVYGSSFRFQVLNDEWAEPGSKSHSGESDIPERTIKEVRVSEFGPTVFPANPFATAGTRSTTDEFYENLQSRSTSRYSDALARAAKARGAEPSEEDEDRASEEEVDTTENTTEESVDNTQTEDSQSEHSQDSRNETDDDPEAHSEDSQDEGTPEGEGGASRQEDAETKPCEHTGCKVWNKNDKRTGKNTDWKCLVNHD